MTVPNEKISLDLLDRKHCKLIINDMIYKSKLRNVLELQEELEDLKRLAEYYFEEGTYQQYKNTWARVEWHQKRLKGSIELFEDIKTLNHC